MTYARRPPSLVAAALAAVVLLGLSACQAPAPDAGTMPTAEAQRYTVRGRVVEAPKAGTLTVEHEAIPGYMAAMTMPFTAKDPAELDGLTPGDAVQFTYVVAGTSAWIADVEVLPDDAVAEHPAEAEAPEHIAPSDESIYQLASTWTNQDGERLALDALHGRPVVLSMIFTNCTYACPMIVRDMKQIGAALPESLRGEVRYALVSLDPERDTPARLRRFATAHELDPTAWTLLRGSARDVRLLAALLGIRYRQEADGQFSHTNLITILNPEGEIVFQQEGLGSNPTPPASALADMLADER